MAHKQVTFQSGAREKILRGVTQLADAVRITLDPKSKSVLIQKSWGAPIVCYDGVTIAKEFDLPDAEENLGAQMLRHRSDQGRARGVGECGVSRERAAADAGPLMYHVVATAISAWRAPAQV